MFANRLFTKSPVNQTQGKKLSSDGMKGRIYEVNFADLNPVQNVSKKVKLIVEEADGGAKLASTNFYGLDTTRDYLCSLIRKWHSLIEVQVDCQTTDGYLFRFFVITFTARSQRQLKGTSFAQRSQIKQIRQIIRKTIISNVVKCSLKELVTKLFEDKMSHEMENKAKKIFPIENCLIRKVKSVKRPRFDQVLFNQMQADAQLVGVTETKKEEEKPVASASENLVK